jgi:hypothetical protein
MGHGVEKLEIGFLFIQTLYPMRHAPCPLPFGEPWWQEYCLNLGGF